MYSLTYSPVRYKSALSHYKNRTLPPTKRLLGPGLMNTAKDSRGANRIWQMSASPGCLWGKCFVAVCSITVRQGPTSRGALKPAGMVNNLSVVTQQNKQCQHQLYEGVKHLPYSWRGKTLEIKIEGTEGWWNRHPVHQCG